MIRSRWMAHMVVVAGLTVPMAATATPPVTWVQDTLYKADGTRFEGIAVIEWKSFRAADGSEVPQNILSMRISGGSLRISLVPTTNALQPAYYSVRYNADGRTQFTEYWSIPPSALPLRLSDVRTHGPIASPVTEPPVTIAIQDISGLRTELDLRPAKGASWMPARTAAIGSSGGIEGVIGSAGDCVRVDGSSGPCGTAGLLYVDADIPNGVVDGVNTAFILSAAPSPAASLTLYRNGVLLRQGLEYTITGSNITMAPGHAPSQGDLLQAWYRIASEATITLNVADREAPAGTIDGVNQTFTLSGIPLPAASLQVFRNGLLQKSGVDYTVSVNVLTFLSVSVPQPGDILQATYRQ